MTAKITINNYPLEFIERFEELIKVEGGYVNDPDDRGGETNFGITKTVARENGFTGEMKDLTQEEAKAIYYKKYWKAIKLDKVFFKSAMVAGEMFDTGVNMGTGTAVKFLQESLNYLTEKGIMLEVDGIIGPKTIDKIAVIKNKYNGEVSIYKMLNILQAKKYLAIVDKYPSQKKFLRGWLTRVNL